MSLTKILPVTCPSCGGRMKVQRLHCQQCDTAVSGAFDLPVLNHLNREELDFVLFFVKTSGSIKDMSAQLGLSYPTVRNMLDDLIAKITKTESELQSGQS
jgi:hypothetical protein